MKKFRFLFGFLALFILAQPAFALNCKTGNDASDECWTTAQLRATGENISNMLPGTLMMYDFLTPTQHGLDPNDSDRLAFYVRAAGATIDNHLVAGVYQGTSGTLASGDRVQLQVRGKGKVRTNGSVVTGDRLYVQAQSGAGNFGEARVLGEGPGSIITTTTDTFVAWALQSSTSASTIDAYIVVV